MGKKNLTCAEKESIAVFLLADSKNGVPRKGKINEAANKWGVSRATIRTYWNRAKPLIQAGENISLPSRRIGNTNHPKIVINKESVMAINKKKRGTIEKLAKALNVSYGTVQKWTKEGSIRKHTNAIHPSLTEDNKLHRLHFSLSALFYDYTTNETKFKDMSQIVHIDEKWFYLTKNSETYYMLPEEEDPHRTTHSKRYIPKVMFMCGVSRPLYSDEGEVLFDGKIGIFPFTYEAPARRSSRNRPAGTMETKPIESITKSVVKDCLINRIIPAIKSKWPTHASKTIFIQQDNARPHITDLDPDFRAAASSDGFDIHLIFQPPNSPDLNVNDLGFFRSIQSLQAETAASNVETLVEAIKLAFELHDPTKLNYNFLSLQGVMVEIMKNRGNNNFRLPHLKKQMLERQGLLPTNLIVDNDLVRECLQYLCENGRFDGLLSLMLDLG